MKKIIYLLRSKFYSLFYKIGKNCRFGKITFWDCDKDGINIGNNVSILRQTDLCGKKKLPIKIGDNTMINQQCIIRANTTIGSNVNIGQKVSLVTDSHQVGATDRRAGATTFEPINIGDGTWIGTGATVIGGVNIGKGCIIAAGSVVIKDCDSDCLYAGVPAKLIKKLD